MANHISTQNALGLVTTTLKRALQLEATLPGLTLHSDQGGQCRSPIYFSLTRSGNISPSMSRPGNSWDNAPVENFFSNLKEEAIRQVNLKSIQQTREGIYNYIRFYNYERMQFKAKLTPFERRCQSV